MLGILPAFHGDPFPEDLQLDFTGRGQRVLPSSHFKTVCRSCSAMGPLQQLCNYRTVLEAPIVVVGIEEHKTQDDHARDGPDYSQSILASRQKVKVVKSLTFLNRELASG
ncbi:hypothetical protein VNO78_26521 [Psophocarpus tetragonolobus]|uniref:Uncharacterized protein n=1 Tax=Psophocarpus tetragonolobus TaxID=3891 RepID=A0AAN9S0B4_PSOTE